jgi:hypothetical protein
MGKEGGGGFGAVLRAFLASVIFFFSAQIIFHLKT